MAWWRAHDEAVDDPKLQKLPAELFRQWFNVMCLVSRNGGRVPSITSAAFGLRKSEKESQRILDALLAAKLLDAVDGELEPHNWNGRQYKSDVSTPRVKAFRERKKKRSAKPDETVSRNAPETEQSRDRETPPGFPLMDTPSTASAREGLGGPAHDILTSLTEKLRA